MLSTLRESLAGMAAVVRRDVQRALSYRALLLASTASEVVSLIMFFYVSRFVSVEPFTPDAYFAFVVVGLVALQLAHAVLFLPLYLLVQELVAGNFERLVVSPLGAPAGLIATMVLPFASALAGSVLSLALAVLVFDVSLHWPTVPLALPAAVLIGLSFAPFGILLLAAGLLMKQASTIATWFVTGLSLLAGLYFPVAVLPSWIRWTSEVQPLTPAVDLMRHLLVGMPPPEPVLLEVVKLAAFGLALLPPTLWAFSRALRLSRRRATIIEY